MKVNLVGLELLSELLHEPEPYPVSPKVCPAVWRVPGMPHRKWLGIGFGQGFGFRASHVFGRGAGRDVGNEDRDHRPPAFPAGVEVSV